MSMFSSLFRLSTDKLFLAGYVAGTLVSATIGLIGYNYQLHKRGPQRKLNISSWVDGDWRKYIVPRIPHEISTASSNIQELDVDDEYTSYVVPRDYTIVFRFY